MPVTLMRLPTCSLRRRLLRSPTISIEVDPLFRNPEIDLIVVNGRPVDFGYAVANDDRIAVYPRFRSFDVDEAVRVGPAGEAEPRFVCDVHLGRLAAYLRVAGFDTQYRNDYSDRELVAISAGEQRTLLTRDVGVLKHRSVMRGYFVRRTQPAQQLVEVLQAFDLVERAAPFTAAYGAILGCGRFRKIAWSICSNRARASTTASLRDVPHASASTGAARITRACARFSISRLPLRAHGARSSDTQSSARLPAPHLLSP